MKITVMQPSFLPPSSYMRLFAASDVFVILDSVQLNRRWFTHRQKLTDRNGVKNWLTLPLKHTPRDATLINQMQWGERGQWPERVEKFNMDHWPLDLTDDAPLEYVCGHLKDLCWMLNIPYNTVFASALEIAPEYRAQDRIIAICKKMGATEYVNSPGGKLLYDEKAFSDVGIKLTFLPEHDGSYDSVAERLREESTNKISKEIMGNI